MPAPDSAGSVKLSHGDRDMLEGRHGPACRMAMSILRRMAEVQGAAEFLDITKAHIDSSIYMGAAGLEFAERLARAGGRVAVPTTLNVSALDEHHWKEWAVPPDYAEKARRQMMAYKQMGCRPIWTCAPYQGDELPRFGEQIAWGESNAIAFANSVIGARTERYPDLMDICAALTGRAPAVGLHLAENRAGQILLPLSGIPVELQRNDEFYAVLGHLVGKIARDRIPVIDGLVVQPTEDQFKALAAGSSASGAVALFHAVGWTPEAPTVDRAFQGRRPGQTIPITMQMLCQARRDLTTAIGETLDMVVLGSPHFSLAEFRKLAPLVEGRSAAIPFLVTSSRAMTALAESSGLLKPLREFGGRVTVDTCILASPMLPPEIRRLMTNSAKYAYYTPGLLRAEIAFGSLEDCVRSAVAGRIVRDDSQWELP